MLLPFYVSTYYGIGSTPEECMLNAKYAISVARKIGACVFLSPADITEGKVSDLFKSFLFHSILFHPIRFHWIVIITE